MHVPSDQLPLERFRQYLILLARMNIGDHYHGKLDASDIVQQTLLEAHAKKAQFRGQSEAELAAWLRQMLAFGIKDAIKSLGRAKRDIQREQSLEARLDASSASLNAWLAADVSSPSHHMQNEENVLRLAESLAKLPDQQREAMVLRHCHGWTFAQIAKHMGCSAPNVVGLITRGTKQLREFLDSAS